MDEQGFDFKPSERREPKPYEPPPWERDAFEELQRAQPEKSVVPAKEPEQEGAESVAPQEPASSAASEQSSAPDDQIAEAAAVGPERPALDEARVIEMLSELSAEEPAKPNEYFAVGFGAGLVLVAIGGVLIVWGMAALVSSRQTGWVGQWSGAGLGMFGVFFMGMGVWMLYRTLKQRGVL